VKDIIKFVLSFEKDEKTGGERGKDLDKKDEKRYLKTIRGK